MAFGIGNAGQGSFGQTGQSSSNITAQNGPDLEDIQTEALGFLAIAGEAKLQLLPTSWPSDNLPKPTSSLLSVASQKGLIAAAGPDAVVIASTDSVRKAFAGPRIGDGNTRSFQPQLILPMPMRISQVAFTADEKYLVLAAEIGGGLAVYDVDALKNGATDSAFQLSTNSVAVRALIPNPTTEKGDLVAVVLTDGKLMMANMNERNFVDGSSGTVLRDGVSCVSWSRRGKQLVVGMGDGTATQLTAEGVSKADIPRPPNADANSHMSAISWLENNVFLTTHTPSHFDDSQPPESSFHIVTRSPPTQFMFQKIADPTPPYGVNRSPPHHFLLRLKEFPPKLQDLLIVASSASTDIGLLSRSKIPLVTDKPADRITDVFTLTEMANDSRRAQLPMTEDMSDTSPIGLALDLSSRDKILKPIPAEEYDESPTPLPGVLALNNEGVLSFWWIIYNDSIRQGTVYPGLAVAEASQQSTPAPTTVHSAPTPASTFNSPVSQPAFGQSSFGKPATTPAFGSSSFTKPAASTFGTPSFGAPSGSGAGSAFGVGGSLGKPSSPWGTPNSGSLVNASATGSVFGSSTLNGGQAVTFGASALPGSKPSPWSTADKPVAPAFGQASSLLANKSSPFSSSTGTGAFGSNSSGIPASGGFASFASSGGFAAASAKTSDNITSSVFGSKTTTRNFGAPLGTTSFGSKPAAGAFGQPSNGTSFSNNAVSGTDKPAPTSSLLGGQSFKLGSTFKANLTAKDDLPEGGRELSSSPFGNSFGNILSEAQSSSDQPDNSEADMDTDEPEVKTTRPEEVESKSSQRPNENDSATLSTTPAVAKFGMQTVTPPVKGNLFGLPPAPTPPSATVKPVGFPFRASSPLKEVLSSENVGNTFAKHSSLFQNPAKEVKKTEDHVSKPNTLFQSLEKPKTPEIKAKLIEENSNDDSLRHLPEAPLPPDTTSKASYAIGNSSSSSEADAPFPPDFTLPAPKATGSLALPPVQEEPKPAPRSGPVADELIPPSHVPGGPEDDGEDESGFETEDSEEEEDHSDFDGSGEDVTKDLSPSSESQRTPAFTPENSTISGLGLSRGDSSFMKIAPLSQPFETRKLFGELTTGKVPVLSPPKQMPSPRSPSPVRGALPGRLLRPDSARSVSAPGAASRILSKQPPTGPGSTYALSVEQARNEERRLQQFAEEKKAIEAQILLDNEDESILRYLNRPLEATRHLDEFVAHHDHVLDADRNNIPAQVEAVFRDVNSMLDILGLNSRALQNFMKGQSEGGKDQPRTKDDLGIPEDWCLVEIETLESIITTDLTRELDHGRLRSIEDKIQVCEQLERELPKLRSKQEGIKQLVATHSEPDQVAMIRGQPLTSEQLSQQHELRKSFTALQQQLADAEEALSLLRARLASQVNVNGKQTTGPTVEAVMKTIAKMTSMAEKRSGDVDVLETQMRKLRMASVRSEPGSHEDSPLTTPLRKSALHAPGTASSHGVFYTPESARHESPSRLRNSMASSINSFARSSPARKKMSGFSEEEKLRLKSIQTQRTQVVDKLRSALQSSGGKVRMMDDE